MTWLCARCASPTTSSRCGGSWRRSACDRGSSPTRGGWVDMVAAAGMVALHSARDSATPGPERLHVAELRGRRRRRAGEAAARGRRPRRRRVRRGLRPGAGLSSTRSATTSQVDERSDDLYGYRLHQPVGVAARVWRVMPLRLADPLGSYGDFLAALGCEPRGEPDEHFAAYTLGDGDHGLVGLHPPMDPRAVGGARPMLAEAGAVYLSFETTEDLGTRSRTGWRGRVPGAADRHRGHVGDVLSVADADGLARGARRPRRRGMTAAVAGSPPGCATTATSSGTGGLACSRRPARWSP